jgi:hypothetical protein
MLLAIADIANDNGDAYPGVDKLSVKCNMSHRSAQLTIQDLERIKELQVFENVGTKTISGWTNLYRVILPDAKQGDVRKPNGEIASARPATSKKARLFSEGVQPVTPLKGVQPDSPDDMQPVTPHGVQPVTPNPPEYSPEYPSVNTSDAGASGTVTDTSKPDRSNPNFDAVCEHVFKIDPKQANGDGGRIGPIAAWLNGKSDGLKRNGGKVGFISKPAEPQHVQLFARYWKQKYPDATMPHDFVKFVEAWRAWATSTAKREPIIYDDPAMDLSKPQPITPILMRERQETS